MYVPGKAPFEVIQTAVHGFDTEGLSYPYHTDMLSAADADALRATFDYKVVGAAHGWATGRHTIAAPTDLEYEAAASAVAELDAKRGDILFLENTGQDGAPLQTGAAGNDPVKLRELAARQRDEQTVDAFRYAGLLAASRGVEVRSADMSAGMMQYYLGGIGLGMRQICVPASPHYLNVMQLRNEQAAYSAKDHTLATLQRTGSADAPTGTKRTAMILFGEAHVTEELPIPTIPEALRTIGLEPDVSVLANSQADRHKALEMPPMPDISNMEPAQAAAVAAQYVAQMMSRYIQFG